jgi:hypothetical protein
MNSPVFHLFLTATEKGSFSPKFIEEIQSEDLTELCSKIPLVVIRLVDYLKEIPDDDIPF